MASAILRSLRESKASLLQAVVDLFEREHLLRELERSSALLANEGHHFQEKAKQLEERRRCTLCCVVTLMLVLCFLFVLLVSYLTHI